MLKLVTRRPAPIARRDGYGTVPDNKIDRTRDVEGRYTERDGAGRPLLSPGAGGRWSSWSGKSAKEREEPRLLSERGIFVSRNECYAIDIAFRSEDYYLGHKLKTHRHKQRRI